MGAQGPEILVEESETYARVIFNRPHVRNAITNILDSTTLADVTKRQSTVRKKLGVKK